MRGKLKPQRCTFVFQSDSPLLAGNFPHRVLPNLSPLGLLEQAVMNADDKECNCKICAVLTPLQSVLSQLEQQSLV